jgi:Leucine-rich repeat (LRR) protein
MKAKLKELLNTGEESNVELAFKLAEGMYLDMEELCADWIVLYDFLRKYNNIGEMQNTKDIVLALPSLKWLYLNNTAITTLPKEIGMLSSLERLYLNNTAITTLPKEIGMLSSLETLGLDNTAITTIPKEIGMLSSLERLYLDNTAITTLPKEIGMLSSLKWLYLNNTDLSKEEKGLLPNCNVYTDK